MKERFIEIVLARPRVFIGLTVLLSLSLGLGVVFIQVDDNLMNLLPHDMPSYQIMEQIENTFGKSDFIIIALGKEGETVYRPDVLSAVGRLCDELEGVSGVDKVASLTTVNDIRSSDLGFDVVPLVERERLKEPGYIENIRQRIQENHLFQGFVSEDERYAAITLTLDVDAREDVVMERITRVTKRYEPEYQVYISGMPYIRGYVGKAVRSDVASLLRLVLLILFAVIFFSLRTLKGTILTMAVIGLSVLPTMGLMGLLKVKFTLINTSMPVILLAVACADSIHIITHFLHKYRGGLRDVKHAIALTMSELLLPVVLTSVTTLLGFLSLTPSEITALLPYGLLIGFGVVWAWVLSVTFLPAMISIVRWPEHSYRQTFQSGLGGTSFHKAGAYLVKHARGILVGAVILVIAAAMGIPRLNVEVNVEKFFTPDSPIRQMASFIDDHFTGSTNIAILVDGDIKDPAVLQEMLDVQSFAEAYPDVGETLSIADMIVNMNRAMNGDDPSFEKVPETREQVAQLLLLYSFSGDPADFERFVTNDYDRALINVRMKSLSTSETEKMIKDLERFLVTRRDDVRVRPSGSAVFIKDLVGMVVRSSLLSIGVSLLLIFIVALVALRSFWMALLTAIPLACAVVLNFGLMGWFGIDLSHVTALLSAIVIGVGVDYAIHFMANYQLHIQRGLIGPARVLRTVEDVGKPILLNAFSVTLGFLVLLFSNFLPIRYLGGLVGLSMLTCAFGALIILPAILSLSSPTNSQVQVVPDADHVVTRGSEKL